MDEQGVTEQWVATNRPDLIRAYPGSLGSGRTGTALSHRGMGSNGYVRLDCN